MTKTIEHDARGKRLTMIMDQWLGLNPQRDQQLHKSPQYYSTNLHLIANQWSGEHPQTIDGVEEIL